MEYENSLAYDFRVRSLTKLIEYYDQLNAALNVPLAFVDTRRPAADGGVQLSLSFQPTKPVLCVIGEKCAGKSTLANALIKEHDAIHIEASTLFGEVASEVGKDFSSDSEVLGFLASAGYNTVARKVVDRLVERSDRMTVITGLRTPEEINYLQDHVDDLVVVWVSAEQRLRYERHLRRQRDPSLQTYRAFAVRDEAQRSFGALRFSSEIADYTVANNGSREEYLQKVKILADEILRGGGLDRDVDPGRFEDYRCLLALQRLGRVATCEEISDETARIAERVRLYNANRALKAVPEFADRIERKGRRLSYSPTERTAAAISLLERRRSRSPAG
jgi:dephospho-CoA kinase